MCTRFYIDSSPEIQPYIDIVSRSPLTAKMEASLNRELKTKGEVRPTDMAAVIALTQSGSRSAFPMVWGYHIPRANGPVVNARVETAYEKRSFAEDWRRHRCIIPASYFIEWEHFIPADEPYRRAEQYAIRPANARLTLLAGLYHIEYDGNLKYPVFTVLTREPSADVAKIHNRMPLILPENAIDKWLNPNEQPEEIVKDALTDMILKKVDS